MKLTGFVIGIRFNKSFSIIDNFGAIMDRILNESDEVFNNQTYGKYETYHDARVLINDEGTNRLILSPENIIVENSKIDDFENDFSKYLNSYQKIIADSIFATYSIKKINRFGCIIRGELEKSDTLFDEIEKVINIHHKTPDSLSIRFNCSKNKPKEIKGTITGDYSNQIFSYSRKKSDSLINFSVDYQHYFRPSLNKLEDSKLKFQTFCNNSLNSFKSEYLNKG